MMVLRRVVRRLLTASFGRSPARSTRGVRILSYHKVNDELCEGLTVSRQAFAQQMATIRETSGTLRLERAVENIESAGEPEGLVVTFDDGFSDNYCNALPVLRENGLTAAFFVTTDYIGSARTFPRDRKQPAANKFMNWAQVQELVEAGMTVGAHTATHVKPNSVALKVFREEVARSKNTLEDKLGRPCEFFAYPWGRARDFRREHVEIVRELGFRAALTTVNGVNAPGQDLFRLRRTTVYGTDDSTVFEAVLAGRLDGFSLKNLRLRVND